MPRNGRLDLVPETVAGVAVATVAAKTTEQTVAAVAAIATTRLHGHHVGLRRRHHFDARYARVLRRDLFLIDALRLDHDGLGHHDGRIFRRHAMRHNGAGRDHHVVADRAILRRHDLLLVTGGARRRSIAVVAACLNEIVMPNFSSSSKTISITSSDSAPSSSRRLSGASRSAGILRILEMTRLTSAEYPRAAHPNFALFSQR